MEEGHEAVATCKSKATSEEDTTIVFLGEVYEETRNSNSFGFSDGAFKFLMNYM